MKVNNLELYALVYLYLLKIIIYVFMNIFKYLFNKLLFFN